MVYVPAVGPAHFGVSSALGIQFPERGAMVREEVGDWFVRRAPFVCMTDAVLSLLHPRAVTLPRFNI